MFLTHLHFDHCGGSILREGENLVPAFPNAVYWSNQSHWDWAVTPNAREKASFLKENILPIRESGQLKFIDYGSQNVAETEGLHKLTGGRLPTAEFSEQISLRFVSGHTRDMMLPQIKYKDRTIVFMADLLPSQGHIPLPYVMAYDMFPLRTLDEKKSFLEEAVENDYILFFEHDPLYECCNLIQTEKGIRPHEFFKLADI